MNNNHEIKTNHNLNQLFSNVYDPQYIHIKEKKVSIHVEEWYLTDEHSLCFKLHHIPKIFKVNLDQTWELVVNEALICSL
jgi:hypothetical protein